MKKSFYSIGSIIILLLAALIFVLIPAMSDVAVTRYPDYGSYNGRPIRYEEGTDFYSAVNQMAEQYEDKGYDFNSNYASTLYAQIFSQAFQNAVGEEALLCFTESSGYKVPTSAINRSIRNLDMFRDSSGTFSPALYQSYTETEKRKAQQNIVKTLTELRSYEDIFGSMSTVGDDPIYGMKTSSAEIEFIRKMGEKQYSFRAVGFDLKAFPDAEKLAFGTSHKDLFVKYNLKVITCESESKAKEVLKRINNSEITFEDAIKVYSKRYYGDPETGVLSASYKYQLASAVTKDSDLDSITSLAVDAVSPIIETASGYCVFKATEAPVQPDFEDDSILNTVFSYLLTREKSVIEDYYTTVAKDFAAKAVTADFDATALAMGAPTTSIAPFALNYNDTVLVGKTSLSQDPILKYAVSNENFYKVAFKLKKDELSAPIVLSGANQVIVLKCTDIITSGTPAAEARAVIVPEIEQASKYSINYSILSSDKVKNNAAEFMKAFNGTKS